LKRLLRRLRREDGVALIEFAVVLPVLLLILFGILYFSTFLNYSTDETHLAAEAVRYAAVNNNPSSSQTLQSYMASQATPGLQATSNMVTSPVKVYLYYPTGSSGAQGTSVRACVTATVAYLPYLGFGSATIAQTATMRVEQTASNWSTSNNPTSTVPSQCPTS
jgi:Flp pilus assembly protein TadG